MKLRSFAGVDALSITSSPWPGGWKTITWPRSGSENRYQNRDTSTRSPISSVFSIDSDGMRYGFTTNHCTR